MADGNCLSADLPPPILQIQRVQTPEPEASYCVVCRMTIVSCMGSCSSVALARITPGLRGDVAFNCSETTAVRGLNTAGIALGRGARLDRC